MPEAARTLVKSPPELWAEVSDPSALARHLGAFGEIRITRLEPEATVAWEGERASGTVDLAPAGWGTRVTVRVEERPVPTAAPVDAAVGTGTAAEPAAEHAAAGTGTAAEAAGASLTGPAPEHLAGSAAETPGGPAPAPVSRAAAETPGGPAPERAGEAVDPPAPPAGAPDAGTDPARPRGRGLRAFLARMFAGRRTPAPSGEPGADAESELDRPATEANGPAAERGSVAPTTAPDPEPALTGVQRPEAERPPAGRTERDRAPAEAHRASTERPSVERGAAPEPERARDAEVPPAPVPEPRPAPEPEPLDAAAILDGMLSSLGAAHHRPFSRWAPREAREDAQGLGG